MDRAEVAENQSSDQTDSATQKQASAGILQLATDWVAAVRGRVEVTSDLAMAEAKLAAISLALIVMLAFSAAILLIVVWGLILAGAIYGLLQAGVPVWVTLAGLITIHIILALVMVRRAYTLSDNLRFRETRRAVRLREENDE